MRLRLHARVFAIVHPVHILPDVNEMFGLSRL